MEEDIEVIKRIKNGEIEEFSFLVEKYHHRLLGFIYRLVGDHSIVEDLGFEPSENFVEKVMVDVRAYERSLEIAEPFFARIVSSGTAQWALSVAGVLLGAWNIIRLYLSILAPVVCR